MTTSITQKPIETSSYTEQVDPQNSILSKAVELAFDRHQRQKNDQVDQQISKEWDKLESGATPRIDTRQKEESSKTSSETHLEKGAEETQNPNAAFHLERSPKDLSFELVFEEGPSQQVSNSGSGRLVEQNKTPGPFEPDKEQQ